MGGTFYNALQTSQLLSVCFGIIVEKHEEGPAKPAISSRGNAKSVKEPESAEILTEDATELWTWTMA